MPEKLPDEIVQSIAIDNAKSIQGQPAEVKPTQEILTGNTMDEVIKDLKAATAHLNRSGAIPPGKP